MNHPTTLRFIAVCLTGALYPLCFPNLDMGWLAWGMLVPLHLAIDAVTPREAFRWGWLAGLLGFLGTVHWVITAMHAYGKVPLAISLLLLVFLAGYIGVYVGVYAWGVAYLRQTGPVLRCLGASSVWVALEYLRTHLLSGFPWALLGYSQYQWRSVIQVADITSVYGVSFLIVLTNVTLAHVIGRAVLRTAHSSRPFPVTTCIMTGTLLAGTLGYGEWKLAQYADASTPTRRLNVGVIQGNIDQAHKWDEAYRQETVDRYDRLSRQAGQGADLLVWPESATPFFFEREPAYQQQIAAILRDTHAPLLFGSPTLRRSAQNEPYLYNSAYLLTAEGTIAGRYDKRHLVPFGEYIPLQSVLFFLNKLVVGIGDFRPGHGPLTLTLPAQDARPAVRMGVAICFEVIFPDLVRRMAQEGADLLITITNDAWFGDSVAPYQHFGMVVFRAVENRVAFARSANTGISGFIAPDGAILSATPILTQQASTASLPMRIETSFYSQYGDVFAWVCVIMASVVFWRARRHTSCSSTNEEELHQ